MPLYTFLCPRCGATFDMVVHRDRYQVTTDSHCGCVATAQRLSVYQTSSPRKYGSEFVMPSSVRAAIDEAVGYKHEAAATMQEAVANGWKARE